MEIEYLDMTCNRGGCPAWVRKEIAWGRTLVDVRKKAADYEKRAEILCLAGELGKAMQMRKKAAELRREVQYMELRGQLGADAEKDTRHAQAKMLQIEMR